MYTKYFYWIALCAYFEGIYSDHFRLPQTVTPESYYIKIIPFIEENNFTFKGVVSIWVNAREETTNITLHAKDLDIDNSTLSVERLGENDTLQELEIIDFEYDVVREFIIIHLSEPLEQKQKYKISIKYEGILSSNKYKYYSGQLRGFHRIHYKENNDTKWVLATDFEPTKARMAFPCFDEPAFKATFKISLARPQDMSSVSNMPQDGLSEPVDGLPDYLWDHYQESPRMSTYLVCWVISEFEKIDNKNFSAWARKEVLPHVQYALSIAPKILTFYENYFQTDYPLPKMDMITFPEFRSTAMENWGLITYHESAFLYQEGVTSIASLVNTGICVAHEVAHQWFGNLVTLEWWSDTWLNEGFATYVSYLGINEVEPQWEMLDKFVRLQTHIALESDSSNSSRKLKFDVETPDEIDSVFDPISYSKGASILRMMEHFLTTPVLHRGLMLYINLLKYGNADQNDLWAALTTVAHEENVLDTNVTIKEIMDTWTLKEGYPIVTVTRNYTSNTVTFTQNRFFSDYIPEESSFLWWIPISYTTKNNPDFNNTAPKLWLEETRTKTVNVTAQRNEWLMVNLKQTGFYVVNYDPQNWMMIINQLQNSSAFEQIHVINRMQILYDLFAFAKVGILNYALALEASKYLIHEESELPWSVALENLEFVSKMLGNTQYYNKFQQFLVHLISPIYMKNGFEDARHNQSIVRSTARKSACLLGINDCVDKCYRKFSKWKKLANPDLNNPIHPKFRRLTYCVVAKYGTEEDWEFLFQRFLRDKFENNEEYAFIDGLACSENPQTLTTLLDRSLTRELNITNQNTISIFQAVGDNPVAEDLVFDYLKNNWSKFVDYVGNNSDRHGRFLHVAAKSMQTQTQLTKVKEFAARVNISERHLEQLYIDIEKNIVLRGKHFDNIVEWVSTLNFVN